MQTFLPYPNHEQTARVLDTKRLKNQRNEALVILKTLLGEYTRGWSHHPAVKMWSGYERALIGYAMFLCDEIRARGITSAHGDSTPFRERLMGRVSAQPIPAVRMPPWWGDERLHRSHRSNLLKKNPEWYSRFWQEPELPYFWPV